jgi:glutathione S-transferase
MDITLYHMPNTRSIRPLWLLEELGQPCRIIPMDLFAGDGETPEYKAIHPLGQLPAIKVDGDIMLESGAICHWLTDRFPEQGLAPVMDDPGRMQYEQWMSYSQATLEPCPWLMILHSKILPEPQRQPDIARWAHRALRPVLAALNDALLEKDYLLGKNFSTADIMVGSTLIWIADHITGYPELLAYVQRLRERPAYQRASASA